MKEADRTNGEWPLWKCATLTAILCGIPLLFFAGMTLGSGIVWVACILVFLGIVRLYGSGHVIVGGLLAIIIAVISGLVLGR